MTAHVIIATTDIITKTTVLITLKHRKTNAIVAVDEVINRIDEAVDATQTYSGAIITPSRIFYTVTNTVVTGRIADCVL